MTVGELITKLEKLPQDAVVHIPNPRTHGLTDRPVQVVTEDYVDSQNIVVLE